MTDWSKLKVVDLKKELSTRGLLQTGLKQDLVNRLTADEEKTAAESFPRVETDAPEELQSRNGDASILNGHGAEPEEKHEKVTNLADDLRKSHDSLSREEVPDVNSSTESLNASAENLVEGSTLIETSAEKNQQTEQPRNILPVADGIAGEEIASKTSEAEPTRQSGQGENDEKANKPAFELSSKELVKDNQKRKRRSLTPDIPSDDASKKRMYVRQSPDGDSKLEEVEKRTTKDDAEWIEIHNDVESSEIKAEEMQVGIPMEDVETNSTIVDVAKEEIMRERASVTKGEQRDIVESELNTYPNENLQITTPDEILPDVESAEPEFKTKDGRFKDLFPSSKTDQNLADEPMEGIEIERVISPAIHPATTALYIRDFMRPLNPTNLREYLALLATPPSSATDPSIVQEFYVDTIRTHVYVSFSNISAASRVRSAIHGTIWPEETNRKPLWADFIPAEKVQDWIDEEKSSAGGSRTGGKKFEVAYEEDYNGSAIAVLRESDPRNVPARQNPTAGMGTGIPSAPRGGMAGVPLGPRSNIPHDNRNPDMLRRPPQFAPTEPSRLVPGFKSTISSPQLYYQPVPKELAQKRLDNMDRITRQDYRRDEQGAEIHRYTFEDGDRFVDRGPEVFEGIRPPRGLAGRYRGGAGDNPRFRDRRDGRGRDRDRFTGGSGRYGGGRSTDDGYRGAGTRRY